MIVFWAPLLRARLGATGAHWQEIFGDGAEQLFEQRSLAPWMSSQRVNGIGKMVQAIQGAFEGDPDERDVLGDAGALH